MSTFTTEDPILSLLFPRLNRQGYKSRQHFGLEHSSKAILRSLHKRQLAATGREPSHEFNTIGGPLLKAPNEHIVHIRQSFVPSSLFSTFAIDMSSIAFLASIFKSLAILGMVIGGVIVFIPQYMEIWKTGNAEGFSTHVCLILIVANMLRLCFWFAVRFETPLLLQSIFVTIAMLAMQELCVRCRLKRAFVHSRQKTKRFIDLDFDHFWNWTYFSDYLYFLSIFFVFIAFITNLFLQSELFIDTLGFVALCTEALLLLPQLLRNFERKSTDGLSVKMVLMMLCGDLFKTFYYILRDTPGQFYVCSSLQCGIDIAILYQVCHYGTSRSVRTYNDNNYKRVDSLDKVVAAAGANEFPND
ncbi:solute carrier family 66 member 2-like [Convolutriloba macropyga]|uniref:solute carrier family 66 member 2-like n=1 Tax=Convolutriloba macropyga TaxID=536237 RepID=UPI003F524B5C